MTLEIGLSFLVTFLVSVILTPVIGKITKKLGIIAHTNNRTIHHGIIPRTGGYAIYVAFLIGAMIFLKTDTQINSMLIGGFIIFLVGFYDDIHDLPPKIKLLGQIIAALTVIFYGGISLKGFTLPFLPTNISYIIAIIITIGWIIGITNAINLIDGLDGLCAGISIIVLVTISLTSLTYGRTDIASLSLLLAGAIGGFLVFNFHPAKIFMGDCGALFIGFMIAVISLLGFGYKSSTFFTLGAPIVVLAVPIMDTLIAIIRRKVAHKRFDEADRGHLHHKLMFSLELGQTKSVLILYGATALFSLCSYLYIDHKFIATILFIILLTIFEIFVEMTNMISRKYKPVLTIANIFIKSDNLPKIKETKPYQRVATKLHGHVRIVLIVLLIVAIAGGGIYYFNHNNQPRPVTKTNRITYVEADNETSLMKSIYAKITDNEKQTAHNELCQYVAAYFATDYYTLSNKEENEIGGIDYFYSSKVSSFKAYAKTDYYKNVNSLIQKKKAIDEVTDYDITSITDSQLTLSGLEDYNYYDVNIKLTFNQVNTILGYKTINVRVTLIEKQNRFSVISLDYINGV